MQHAVMTVANLGSEAVLASMTSPYEDISVVVKPNLDAHDAARIEEPSKTHVLRLAIDNSARNII
jgi:hypothetical protein